MESLTKVSVPIKIIQKIMDNAVEKGSIRAKDSKIIECIEMKNGYFNTIYLLKLFDFEVILKIAPTSEKKILRYEKKIMQAEVDAINLCFDKLSVKVPKIFYYDNSKQIVDFEYLIMEKLEGRSFNEIEEDFTEDEIFVIERNLGKVNKQINQICGDKFGYLAQEEKQSEKWSEAFLHIINDIIVDGKDEHVDLPYERMNKAIQKNLFALDYIKQPKLVHWDLWRGNVLVENRKIMGLIDFERALWADPIMECYFSAPQNKGFYEGYGMSWDDFDEFAKIRRNLYNLYYHLVLKVECYYRGYVNSSQHKWAGDQIIMQLKNLENK